MNSPWLSIIGLNEDGLSGLSGAARAALEAATVIFGGPRHLDLAAAGDRGRVWPVPFSTAPVLACRGQRVVVLASGDPFWHGAGGSLLGDLRPGEWQSFPAPSTFSLAANLLGWRLEDSLCLGLHAAPFARLLPHLTKGQRLICTLRDGAAAGELAAWLTDLGATARLHVLERLGGPAQRQRDTMASAYDLTDVQAPVAIGIDMLSSAGFAATPGLADDLFHTDGQITKAPIRALTLCALAPRKGAVLWDIGAGSGSISVEWCLQGGKAIAIETRQDRLANITANIARFGLGDRMQTRHAHVTGGTLPPDLPAPDAVFIGGGADQALLTALFARLPAGVRLVVNTVTLETESLVQSWQAAKGGTLMKIDIAQAAPLGRMRGWTALRPVVQWSVLT
jgi:precorrin-6B C5,15-methyltransferase / cobalt-precorrin-6B C5,C15-methyltransferase